jgi:hypothetical protein
MRGRNVEAVWIGRLAPLMERPGEAARVLLCAGPSARAQCHNLRSGKYRIPEGRWDFVSRELDQPIDGNTHGVWARYLGPLVRAEDPRTVRGVDPLAVAVELPAPAEWPRRARNLRSVGDGRVR